MLKIPGITLAHTWPGILHLLCLLVVTFTATAKQTAAFVGSAQCVQCHENIYADWQQSDHHKAMQPASKDNVLGDFSDVTVRFHGIDTRLFENDGTYRVATVGKDGERRCLHRQIYLRALPAAAVSDRYWQGSPAGAECGLGQPASSARRATLVPFANRRRYRSRASLLLDAPFSEREQSLYRVPQHQRSQELRPGRLELRDQLVRSRRRLRVLSWARR